MSLLKSSIAWWCMDFKPIKYSWIMKIEQKGKVYRMDYYLFPLTEEESMDPCCLGWAYAKEHEDRWVLSEGMKEVNTYDKGTTHIVHENKVYIMHKDYVDITANKRVYVGKYSQLGTDIIS